MSKHSLRVSHEVPLSLLEASREFNSFDYGLVHLFERYPKYKQFYINSRWIYDRDTLVDNSLFELGHSFDPEAFYKELVDVRPSMFIVPDVMEDGEGTKESFLTWDCSGKTDALKNLCSTRAIGVVQGKTWSEMLDTYKFMVDHADMIAISFDLSYYQYSGEGRTRLEKLASGRQRFVEQLINKGVWDWNKPVHLLGCSLQKEFRYYCNNNIYNIESCDTSNPIVAAIEGLKYNGPQGLDIKPKQKLADLIEHEFTLEQIALLQYNVQQFAIGINKQPFQPENPVPKHLLHSNLSTNNEKE